jgi:hypothetical protein
VREFKFRQAYEYKLSISIRVAQRAAPNLISNLKTLFDANRFQPLVVSKELLKARLTPEVNAESSSAAFSVAHAAPQAFACVAALSPRWRPHPTIRSLTQMQPLRFLRQNVGPLGVVSADCRVSFKYDHHC